MNKIGSKEKLGSAMGACGGYVAVMLRLCGGCVAVVWRVCGSVDMWLCGSVAMLIVGSVALRLCGSAALWLCGSVALWLSGSVALWLWLWPWRWLWLCVWGGVVRARAVAKAIEVDLAIIDKRRPKAGVAEVMNVIGEVDGKHCILIDDIVDTAGTLCKAADALVKNGALSVSAYATHGVLSGPAVSNIEASAISEVVVTDSIQPSDAVLACEKIRAMTIAELMGEAIRRVSNEESVSTLFNM